MKIVEKQLYKCPECGTVLRLTRGDVQLEFCHKVLNFLQIRGDISHDISTISAAVKCPICGFPVVLKNSQYRRND